MTRKEAKVMMSAIGPKVRDMVWKALEHSAEMEEGTRIRLSVKRLPVPLDEEVVPFFTELHRELEEQGVVYRTFVDIEDRHYSKNSFFDLEVTFTLGCVREAQQAA